MKRGLESVKRSRLWTAWDLNCKRVFRGGAKLRKRCRRAWKRANRREERRSDNG